VNQAGSHTSLRAARPWLALVLAALVSLPPVSQTPAPNAQLRGLNAASVPATGPRGKQLDEAPAKRWYKSQVVLHVDRSLFTLGPGVHAALQQAFATWTSASSSLPQVVLEPLNAPADAATADGRNTLSLAPIDVTGHQDDLAITVSYRNANTAALLEVDIILNSAKPWALLQERCPALPSSNSQPTATQSTYGKALGGPGAPAVKCMAARTGNACQSRYDLQSVMTHEAGHFFGLGENAQVAAATMYPTTSHCELHKRSLDPTDRQSRNKLYAPGTSPTDLVHLILAGWRFPARHAGFPLAWQRTLARADTTALTEGPTGAQFRKSPP
jgi:hypothetical protein